MNSLGTGFQKRNRGCLNNMVGIPLWLNSIQYCCRSYHKTPQDWTKHLQKSISGVNFSELLLHFLYFWSCLFFYQGETIPKFICYWSARDKTQQKHSISLKSWSFPRTSLIILVIWNSMISISNKPHHSQLFNVFKSLSYKIIF